MKSWQWQVKWICIQCSMISVQWWHTEIITYIWDKVINGNAYSIIIFNSRNVWQLFTNTVYASASPWVVANSRKSDNIFFTNMQV